VLEHNVDAFFVGDLANFLRNFLLIMIDDIICPEFAGLGHFVFVSGRRDHAALEKLRNLNSRDAHAGICSQHEHRLARTNRSAAGKHVPGGEEHQGHAGGLLEVERIGNWNDVDSRDRHEFTIAAIHSVAQNREFAALVLQSGHAF
jgi:hypothetical protein